MTHADDTFERRVHAWLHADAEHRVPDHLDAVLGRTSMARQRPAWLIPERWLPVDTTFRPRFFHVPQAGRLVLVAALIVVLVALLVFAVGSRQQRLPPPFGPARNGIMLSSADGDIFAIDPTTANRTAIVSGSLFEFGPLFSRDGTRFSFLREGPKDCGKPDCGLILVIANADGSGVHELTPAVSGLDGVDWSPDGRQIAILAFGPSGTGHVIEIVQTDGSGMRTIDVGRSVHEPSWLPPDGREIIFRGEELVAGDPPPGIFAVRPDGTGLREISTRPAVDANDYQGVAVSPDGQYVTYQDTNFDANPPNGFFQVHVLSLRTGEDRILPQPKGAAAMSGVFSPDGSQIAYLRIGSNGLLQMVVAPVDGTGLGVAIGPEARFGPEGPTINNYLWSPDGTAVIANYDVEKVARLLPIDGSPATVLAHGELALPAYQRLAP
jgi:dipeptidyl aminopeptidase/acylaminoacyl peptidase